MKMNKLNKILSAAALAFALCAGTAYAAGEAAVTDVEMGTHRDEVHRIIGEPCAVSPDGSKETYTLDGGNAAVLRYCGGRLCFGYIVIRQR